MTWQYIVVFLAIGWAVGVTIYQIAGFFRRPESHCSSCAMQSGKCQLKELKDATAKHNRRIIS